MVSRLAFSLSLSSAISKLVFFLAASSFSLVFTSRSATVVVIKRNNYCATVIWMVCVLQKPITVSLRDSIIVAKMVSKKPPGIKKKKSKLVLWPHSAHQFCGKSYIIHCIIFQRFLKIKWGKKTQTW